MNVDFLAEKISKLRMDVTTTLGVHVASFSLAEKTASYLVPQSKTYYNGPSGANVFKPVMNLNMDPKLLMHILFDIPIKGPGWACSNDKKGFLTSCERSSDQFKVVWGNRKGNEKTVAVTHKEFELEMKFHSFKERTDLKATNFEILQPEGFRKL